MAAFKHEDAITSLRPNFEVLKKLDLCGIIVTALGDDVEFFSFFAISGKFAGVLGPLTFGLAIIITGSLRSGILVLLVFFLAGMGILMTVDESKGREEANVPI